MKKDLDYVAAVETAMAEKYGKRTVQDFRHEWTPEKEESYLAQLKESRMATDAHTTETICDDGPQIKIFKRREHIHSDRTCPVCKTYSFSARDDLYMNRFKCCWDCYIEFVNHRFERWQEGWRPADDQLHAALRRRKNG
tara:strand:- start:8970 stop:9386 length:417 start_codon:yes stop_codon:yes gene_type:complete